jgi:hypothetical protein
MINAAPLIVAALAAALWVNLMRGIGHQKDPGLLTRGPGRWFGGKGKGGSRSDRPKAARRLAILSYLIGLGLVAGIIPVADALAGWTSGRTGVGYLAVLDLLLTGAIWLEVWHLHNHHPAWTQVTCFIAGAVTVDTYASWERMIHQGGKLLPQTFAAISHEAARQKSGNAAKAALHNLHGVHVPGAKGFPVSTVLGLLVIGLLLFVAVGGHRLVSKTRRRSQRRNSGPGAAQRRPVSGSPGRQALGG